MLRKTAETSLFKKLVFSPEKFSFVKAVDVAISVCGSEFVKLKSQVNFSAKFSDVSAIDGLLDGIGEIHTNIGGIAGYDGALPDCFTEKFLTFNKNSRTAITDFFDMLNNRMLSLRYSYSKRLDTASLSVPVERAVIGRIIFSLSGLGWNAAENTCLPEQFRISAQNIFWSSTRSSSGLKTLLSSFFRVPISIEQFCGGFVEVSKDEQTVIGSSVCRYNRVGKSCILGNKVWDAAKGIRIHIGALKYEDYLRFLPKKTMADRDASPLQKMKTMVKMYVPYGIDVSLHFHLERCSVDETLLNGAKRLNKDAFITGIHRTETAHFSERV
ncbi:MAG: type VI secretion system baseplate subunit TssG [Alphaproteobacteria bacterium]|nr:type VI secretion system baseplate subunit TssG [Alphaproteobacteria bacterium]